MPKKKAGKTIIADPMTHIVEVKRAYRENEILEFARSMAEAVSVISEIEAELKEYTTAKKADIAEQGDVIHSNADKINANCEMTSVPCNVTYNGKIVTFTNKDTGEIVEERELTEEEQLRLASQWKDAEEVIREDTEKNG